MKKKFNWERFSWWCGWAMLAGCIFSLIVFFPS